MALPQKSISVVRVSCLIRETSWIVSFVRKAKDDPRSHTNQHEAKHSCLALVPTFEAKLFPMRHERRRRLADRMSPLCRYSVRISSHASTEPARANMAP